jgi:hypothetical protein
MTPEERELMMKIAKKVDEIEKRPWFKRLDEREQQIMLKKMTAPEEKPSDIKFDGKVLGLEIVPGEPLITASFPINAQNTGEVADMFKAKSDMEFELRKYIKDLIVKHGITRLFISYEKPGTPPSPFRQDGPAGLPIS